MSVPFPEPEVLCLAGGLGQGEGGSGVWGGLQAPDFILNQQGTRAALMSKAKLSRCDLQERLVMRSGLESLPGDLGILPEPLPEGF